MKRYLFWCANEHVDFRVPEFESLAEILDVTLTWVEKTPESGEEREPWVIIDLVDEAAAKKLISRSISTRFCIELWADSPTREGLHASNKKHIGDNVEQLSNVFDESKSFKVQADAFMKRYTMEEKLKRINQFQYLPSKASVTLLCEPQYLII